MVYKIWAALWFLEGFLQYTNRKKKPFVFLKSFKHDYRSYGLFCIEEENSSLEQSIMQFRQKTGVSTKETYT